MSRPETVNSSPRWLPVSDGRFTASLQVPVFDPGCYKIQSPARFPLTRAKREGSARPPLSGFAALMGPWATACCLRVLLPLLMASAPVRGGDIQVPTNEKVGEGCCLLTDRTQLGAIFFLIVCSA